MEKEFDCLKMNEELQARVYKKAKDMIFPKFCAYLDESLKNNAFLQRLVKRDKAQKQMEYVCVALRDGAVIPQTILCGFQRLSSVAIRNDERIKIRALGIAYC